MLEKFKNYSVIIIISTFIAIFTIAFIFSPARQTSQTERRPLTQKPVLSTETVLNGKFMSDFEKFTLDQFPMRESFRTLKAVVSFFPMGKKDNNGIYISNGFASKLDYPLSEKSLDYASKRFSHVYNKYLSDANCNVYFSLIPDKNYFLAEKNNYPAIDYAKMVTILRNNLDFAQYIDIFPLLRLDDYYKTDTHWKQENIGSVAEHIVESMDTKYSDKYSVTTFDKPFYGVYYGQAALPMQADRISYIYSPTFDNCRVFDFESNREMTVYDMEEAYGSDPYEMFLSGSKSLLTIENPYALTKKELVMFRDSFASSLAPYLIESYSKITLVDIRYISPEILDNFISFENCDVLFLYSTLVLNNSNMIK